MLTVQGEVCRGSLGSWAVSTVVGPSIAQAPDCPAEQGASSALQCVGASHSSLTLLLGFPLEPSLPFRALEWIDASLY